MRLKSQLLSAQGAGSLFPTLSNSVRSIFMGAAEPHLKADLAATTRPLWASHVAGCGTSRPRWPAGDVHGCCLNLDQSTRMKHSFESFVSFELFVSRVVFQEPTNETRVPVIWVICSIFLGVLDTIPEPFHLVLVGTCDPKPDLISWDWPSNIKVEILNTPNSYHS